MQWVNQTYNAGLNYGNRNASSNYTKGDLLRGYLGALFVSISISLAARVHFAGLLASLSGATQVLANAAIGYTACAFAGASNLALMRAKEMKSGIEVFSQDGTKSYGFSQAAGRKAILQTAISRFILPLPCTFGPALTSMGLQAIGLWPGGELAAKFLELAIVLFYLTFALPFSVALFKQ